MPQPDSPTMPSVSPRLTIEADILDRMQEPLRRARGSYRATCGCRAKAFERCSARSSTSDGALMRPCSGAAAGPRRSRRRRDRGRPGLSGGRAWQASSTKPQRGRNGQPRIGRSRRGGCPGIGCRGCADGAAVRHRVQERLGVGMARVGEDRVDRAGLDDPARIHDRDAIAGLRDDAEIVRDEHHRHAELVDEAAGAASGSDPGS